MKKLLLITLLASVVYCLVGSSGGDTPSPVAPPASNKNRNAGQGD